MADGPRGLQGKQGVEGKQGPRGKNGLKGERGLRGIDGKDGIDGTSAELDDVTTPLDVGTAGAIGSSLKGAHSNHVHKGVRSVKVDGEAQLFGNVVLANGDNVTLEQVGNVITINSSGGGASTLNVVHIGVAD